jgi:serralysin
MNSTHTVQQTGNQDVDGILTGAKWNGATLTYSFPTSGGTYGAGYGYGEPDTGFAPLNGTQQAAARRILAAYSSVANLSFAETRPDGSADIRLAQSGVPSTAWAYELGGGNDGDIWFKSNGTYENPVAGNYAYLTFMHELGHALGLDHGHEDGFGALSFPRDSLEYSVMTYRSYVGDDPSGGYSEAPTSYPQTPMMLDVAALQQLYGPNFGTQSGDTTYRWDPGTGEMSIDGVRQGAPAGNRVFMTLWDGGGHDTYDLSAYSTGVTIDLRPGSWSKTSHAQLASLSGDGRHMAAGTIANALLYNSDARSLIENAIGGAGDNLILGNQAGNILSAGGGRDLIYGNLGADIIYGNQGQDTLFGGQDTDHMFAGKDADVAYGNLGDDQIYGNMGDDDLFGGAGSDFIHGGQGDDLITGGLGNDVLIGGLGADTFVFRPGHGADLIFGFDVDQGDRLSLSGQSYQLGDDGHGGTLVLLSGGGTIDVAGISPGRLSGSAFA